MLTIDQEFKAIIPPLKPEEFEQLEQNILAEGIRDPLVLWQGIILDGHNRYAIAQKHGLTFDTVTIDLPDREAAKLWIINNQLGRRNLTPQQMSYLIGKRYEMEKQDQFSHPKTEDQNDPRFENTADRIAQQTGVSAPTVKRDAEYARAVDTIADIAGSEAREAILGAEVRMTKKDAIEAAKIAKEAPDLIPQIASGELNIPQAKREIATRKQEAARQRKPDEVLNPVPLPQREYRCIVIDPPWPMEKIERVERPDQGVSLDYPVMTIEEIKALPIYDLADKDGCHVYLWVTQKYLPIGLEIFAVWGVKYQCTMTWNKNVGFTPYSWMYDTEHVLFGRIGSLKLERMGLRLSFSAKVTKHSEKPDIFFNERVIPASPEPRLEMFARRPRNGFDVWGNEVNHG